MNWKHLLGAVAVSAATIALVFRVPSIRKIVANM
jgi:hypothetical protein